MRFGKVFQTSLKLYAHLSVYLDNIGCGSAMQIEQALCITLTFHYICGSYFKYKFSGMRKILVLSVPLLMSLSPVSAQDYLVVEEKSGDKTAVSVEEIRKITFDGGLMSVYRNNGEEQPAQFELDRIGRLLFGIVEGGVDEINPDGELVFYTAGDAVGVKGLEHPADAYVVNMGGQVCRVVKDWEGSPEIDVSALPAGVYVLVVGKAAFKFTK